MQSALTFPPFQPSENDGKPNFNVVIAYEDLETGKQAKKTSDFLTEHLGHEFLFTSQMWKFDVLSVPKLLEMAAKDAAAADIIIVSSHGRNDLPKEVKSWLEMALEFGIHAIGIVALFDSSELQENPARSYLAAVAQNANLEFFSQPGPVSGEDSNWTGSSPLSLLAETEFNKRISHWGINE